MLPLKQQHEPDYRKRVRILARESILAVPDIANGRSLRVKNPDVFDELSFALFVAWLFNGVLNRDADKVRINFVPLNDESAQTLLVISQVGTSYAVPGRDLMVSVDGSFLHCPLDRRTEQGTTTTKAEQVFCPVLNKLRYNLGQRPDVNEFQIPKKSEECCASRKDLLWQYLKQTVVTDPDTYGWLFGGVVIPLQLSPNLVRLYATGLGENNGDWAILLDEILLVHAMASSSVMVGVPHATLKAPFESNEIDFLLYDTAGKKRSDDKSLEGCKGVVADQAICIFETTVGHRNESNVNGDGRAIGSDHPKNKIINFLALKSLGFQHLRYHYLTVVGSGDNLAAATKQALEATEGFQYWSLSQHVPELQALVLGALEAPIPIDTLRAWHRYLVDHVREVARDFGGLRGLGSDRSTV